MKPLLISRPIVVFACVALAIGCQKESFDKSGNSVDQLAMNKMGITNTMVQEHKLKGQYLDASYLVIPGPGWVSPNPVPAWYPGEGEGQANLLGKSYGFVNMYVTMGQNGLQGAPAPVNLVYADRLAELGIEVPDAVSIILFDKHGNSIWASGNNSLPVIPESPTKVLFEGNPVIVGGTGKFENATGHFTMSGFFNPQDTEDAGIVVTDGVIVY
jgi:hypothetical protein